MTASLSIAPVAAAKLAALRPVVTREFGCGLAEIASLRTVRPAAELVSVSTVAGFSQCCGHAPDREEGEDCGCQDVSCRLFVRVSSVVKGGEAREITVDGDVTLAGGTFQGRDWSWSPMFAERVEALGLDFGEVEDAIESDV
jgi:hypothetical protein